MEKKLPAAVFTKEWQILRPPTAEGRKDHKRFRTLTQVEQWVPIAVVIPFALLLLVTLWPGTNNFLSEPQDMAKDSLPAIHSPVPSERDNPDVEP